ncbi:hypothetical protein ACIP79_39090 [Streptomyces sp. NPDC088747]|uniref:hypothetical protein n=1 Tax=Streptomyces sp. NPDC088747 TaxID=3365886 RepID=UPI0037F132F2
MTGAGYAFQEKAEVTAADEQRRLTAVRRYAVPDTPPDGAIDKIASLAARIFDVPMAGVAVVDSVAGMASDRVWFKATHGFQGVQEISRDSALRAFPPRADGPCVVTDALEEGRAARPVRPAPPHIPTPLRRTGD